MSRRVCRVMMLLAILSELPVMSGPYPVLTAQGENQTVETTRPGDPARGRALFNGHAICSTCHGIDGDPSQKPLMTPNAARAIVGLRPPPANLREPDTLKLRTDQERFDAIRKGHLLTRMEPVPESVLSDQEIEDLLAYLAILRAELARSSPSRVER
jgi:mono/diheme cytochrome c family protein